MYMSLNIKNRMIIISGRFDRFDYWSQYQIYNMHGQVAKGKYIKQIKLQGKKEYFPNKFFTPYQFIDKFNEVLKKRYDVRIIEVKYVVSKSKHMKDIDEHFNIGNFEVERNVNNVYDLDDPFMKEILGDTLLLVPPNDFDYNKLEEENEAAKKREEDKKIQEVDKALELLNDLAMKKSGMDLRALDSFKMTANPALKESEVEVYVKGVMNQAMEQLLESQKSSKNPIVIPIKTKTEIRLYLHPMKSDPQSIDLLSELSDISDWSLCSLFPENVNSSLLHQGITYWGLESIGKHIEEINGSIKIMPYISLHKNKKGVMDSLQLYGFMCNEIILKAVVNLGQIKKIEFIRRAKKQNYYENNEYSQYYLHLAYPPRYYISIMKPDLGCDDGFIRNWERVENFMFLRNQKIMENEFIRLYLFGNSVLRLRIVHTEQNKKKWEKSEAILNSIMASFKGTIECSLLQKPYELNKTLTSFKTIFKYSDFKNKLIHSISDIDKIWKLKYLILVLIRGNAISPPEIDEIMNHIEANRDDIDIYIYILWQSVSLLGTVNIQLRKQSYLSYVQEEYAQIKKLSISDITKKIGANSDTICYVFKASLTPSGYLYSAPTPQMKGRLLKEYSAHSQHFLRVTISDDNEGSLKNQRYITKGALKSYMRKISIIERSYVPLGWSPSQLRGYSLWYINEYNKINKQKKLQVRLRREQVLSFLGSFDSIENPAKKAARIGQAFSASWTYHCKQNQIKQKVIEDEWSSKGYMFTDGIGKISEDLIQKISLKLSIKDLSVLQIRYKGAKGILVKNPNLERSSIHLRKSMIKYNCTHESAGKYLDILDWNKYKAGFLNRQTIVLLKSLGIDNNVFQKRQKEHIQRISNLSFKDCSIFKHMNEDLNTDISNLEPANVTILQLLRAGFKLEEEPFFRGVLETMKKNGYHQLKMKSNIMIEQSARIIGIIDQYDILEAGELYCTVEDSLNINPKREHVEGQVIITRNPCLHPADIRKMTCISQMEVRKRFENKGEDDHFSEFVNCIIFPKKGDIPVTAQISGSDLDGDNFFISWDRELIPKQVEEIYLIDAPQDKKEIKREGDMKSIDEQYEEMLHFFIQYLNYEKLGQIDNSHLVKADQSQNYAKDKDCIELAKIHGKAVDFPKTGFCPQVDPKLLVSTYPDFMQKQQSPQYYSKSILGILYHDIKDRIQNLLNECEAKRTGKIDEDIIKELAEQLKGTNKSQISFDPEEVRQAVQILLDYQRELSGLISLVGVDTEYQIYSGNFTIAKEKVKIFGKNRLIATILALRARYFEQFFLSSHLSEDKIKYEQAKEADLEDSECFSMHARRRAILFYLTSYIIKFNQDQSFLNDDTFSYLRSIVMSKFQQRSYQKQSKFCGFVWFVIPKLMISQKYRARRILHPEVNPMEEKQEEEKKGGKMQEKQEEDEEEMI